MKKFTILFSSILLSTILFGQTDQKPNEQNSNQEIIGIESIYQQKVMLQPDGHWMFVNENIPVVTANDTSYVLFSNGTYGLMETVTDIDGNTYTAIQLGKYMWMIENLRTTRYNDGSEIPHATTDNTVWINKNGAYTWINDDPVNKEDGTLYSWWAVNTSKLCPKGWKVPALKEWYTLFEFSGNAPDVALKSTTGWPEGRNGKDEFLFNVKPIGYRHMYQDKRSFWSVGAETSYWTTTTAGRQAEAVNFRANGTPLESSWNKEHGRSVRCIKDKK